VIAGFVSEFCISLDLDSNVSSVFISLIVVALIIGWSTSRHTAMAFMVLAKRHRLAWFPMLSAGELLSFLAQDPRLVHTHHFLVVTGWTILGAVVAGFIGRAAAIGSGFLAVIRADSDDSLFGVFPPLRIFTCVLAAAVWAIPWFV
jgi:hypothetical protein